MAATKTSKRARSDAALVRAARNFASGTEVNASRSRGTNGKPARRPQKFATPEAVSTYAADLNDRFLACREMGHNWRPWAAQWVPSDQSYDRVLRCVRCKTERHQSIDMRGGVASNHYVYPDGYQNKGFGRIAGDARNSLRLESVIRAVGDRSIAEEL